jgi:eight-cysteine-cluster-containing protein
MKSVLSVLKGRSRVCLGLAVLLAIIVQGFSVAHAQDAKPGRLAVNPVTYDAPIVLAQATEGSSQSAMAECKPTGCSGQVCADKAVITTCEWLPEYACYKSAKCARQADGKCGWTMSPELEACLKSGGKTK